jgi:hypothetical protein
MVLLGDEAQVEGRFSPFGACFGPNILEARKLFWTDWMVLLGDMGNGESLETLFVSVQHRSTV